MKLSISMNEKLVGHIDEFARNLGLTRSSTISMIVTQYINGQQTVAAMQQMSGLMQELVKNGLPASDEEMEQLDALGKVMSMMK